MCFFINTLEKQDLVVGLIAIKYQIQGGDALEYFEISTTTVICMDL